MRRQALACHAGVVPRSRVSLAKSSCITILCPINFTSLATPLDMQADTSAVRRRLLPLRQQARIVGMLALAAACVLALGWGCSHPETSSTAAGNGGSTAATELRLTNAQLATLGIDQVRTAHFH